MEYDELFRVLSACFAPVDKQEWKELTTGALWSDFLDASRRMLQDDGTLGAQKSPLARVRSRGHCPLQEFLSAGEVKALFAPPTFEEKQQFAAEHFTGGLTESAMPVESLYVSWSSTAADSPFSRVEGMYNSDTAQYMKHLVERMGMQVPPEFAAYPDHLALELDLVAVMLRSGMGDIAREFLTERFEWLTAYRMRLLGLPNKAQFYVGLVDVILGIRAQLGTERAELQAFAPPRVQTVQA